MTAMTKIIDPRSFDTGFPIVALHCSGATWRQWRGLQDRTTVASEVYLPQLSGSEMARGVHRASFSLEVEAGKVVAMLREIGRPAHLVGHSYGGALALHIARRLPELVASLCLYEPTAFDLLKRARRKDMRLAGEISALSASIQSAIDEGHSLFAAQLFTDFWGGLGAWQALDSDKQTNMLGWIPKAPLDFSALLNEPHGQTLPRGMNITLIYGQRTKPHTRRIIDLIAAETPAADLVELEGADHMGPFVFRERVLELVSRHVARNPACK